jgi:hypothetical protein
MPAGALVDRWDPRRTLILSESGRGVAITAVAITVAMGRPSISLLIFAVFIEETLEVFSTLADRRCVRALMPLGQVSSAQASIEARTHAVVLAGRPLGVFLFGLTPILPFLADALSFIVSVGTIASLKSRRAVVVSTGRVSGRQLGNDIGEVLIWLLHDKYARTAFTLSGGTSLIGQALIMVFLAGARTAGLSSIWVALVLAASGVGGVLGSVWASWLPIPSRTSLVLLQMMTWVGALVFLAIWGWRSFLCMGIVMASLSLAGALGNIEIDTYLVQRDENMLARATSIRRFVAFSAFAVGPMLGAVLFQLYGVQNAVFALVAITSIFALLAWLTPSMRDCVIVQAGGRLSWLRLCRHMSGLGFAAVAAFTAVVLVAVKSLRFAIEFLRSPGMSPLSAESSGALSRTATEIPGAPYRIRRYFVTGDEASTERIWWAISRFFAGANHQVAHGRIRRPDVPVAGAALIQRGIPHTEEAQSVHGPWPDLGRVFPEVAGEHQGIDSPERGGHRRDAADQPV